MNRPLVVDKYNLNQQITLILLSLLALTMLSSSALAQGNNPQITSPSNSAPLAGSTVNFSWADNGLGVAQWAVYAGDAPRSYNHYYSGHLAGAVTQTDVTGLPTNGSQVFITLWYRLTQSGPFTPVDYAYTASSANPEILTPTSAIPLSGSTVAFEFTDSGIGVANWAIYAGSSSRSFDYFYSGHLASTTTTIDVPNLPLNGSTVHITLWYRLGNSGPFTPIDYTYTASTAQPVIVAPTTSSPLSGPAVDFSFDEMGAGIAQWALYAGSSSRAFDYFYSGHLDTNTTTTTVTGLPVNGETVHVTLWYRLTTTGPFTPVDYTYTASSSSPEILIPAPSTELSDTSVDFTWTDNSLGVIQWALYAGSESRAFDYFYSGHVTNNNPNTTVTVTGLPDNGSPVHITLWYRFGTTGSFTPIDFTYDAYTLPTTCDYISTCVIEPEDDAATLVNNAPINASFLFKTGTHRPTSFDPNDAMDTWLIPKDGQTFTCESGAILNGAEVLDDPWQMHPVTGHYYHPAPQRNDGVWCGFSQCVANGRPIENGRPINDIHEDLFIDDHLYLRVEAPEKVSTTPALFDGQQLWAGTFYEQTTAPDAGFQVGFDPTGSVTEISRMKFAFRVIPDTSSNPPTYVNNITIDNCIIEKFASPAQLGAIEALFSVGWTLNNVTARYNHGAGLRTGKDTTVTGGAYNFNGHLGIHGSSGPAADWGGLTQQSALSENLIIDNAEIAWNNWAGYSFIWEAGGIKVLLNDAFTITNSNVHHNLGNGIWTDTDVTDTLIDNNTVLDNTGIGIIVESHDACLTKGYCDYAMRTEKITNNTVNNNATLITFDPVLLAAQDVTWWWGSEILIQNAAGFLVDSNTIGVANAQGIGIIHAGDGDRGHGPRSAHDNLVQNNTVTINTDSTTQWWQGYSGAESNVAGEYLGVNPTNGAVVNLFKGNTYIATGINTLLGYWRFDTGSAYSWTTIPEANIEPCSTFDGSTQRASTPESGPCN